MRKLQKFLLHEKNKLIGSKQRLFVQVGGVEGYSAKVIFAKTYPVKVVRQVIINKISKYKERRWSNMFYMLLFDDNKISGKEVGEDIEGKSGRVHRGR